MISYNLGCLEIGLYALLVIEIRWDWGEWDISKAPNPGQLYQEILFIGC